MVFRRRRKDVSSSGNPSEVKVEKPRKRGLFKKVREEIEIFERLLRPEPVIFLPRDPSYEVVSEYWIYEPFAKVIVARLPNGSLQYFVEETPLTVEERDALHKLTEILLDEMRIEPTAADYRVFIVNEFKRVMDRYAAKFGLKEAEKRSKILYYLNRNLLGYGPLDVLMRDPNIEDISCNGVGTPIYVWHREYEYIPTNIVFTSIEYLNELVARLAHLGGKHVSVAFPLVDAILPGGHRFAATYGSEVSSKGPTFTIRKFREKPITITELIANNVISSDIAAYLWFLIENKRTIIIAGGTGAGKTTLMNAILAFVKPGMKITTIEDIPELRLQHDNWVQLVARPSYAVASESGQEVRLFDLVKLSLRYRPDYIIVGEIRGEEAFVLFQAVATGHGGITTLHAESLDYAVKRLTSPPMNIPPSYIPLINAFVLIERIVKREASGRVRVLRRVREVNEIVDIGNYITVAKWNPAEDSHDVFLENSKTLREIAVLSGQSLEEVIEEVKRRAILLQTLADERIFDVSELSQIIYKYYYEPEKTLEEVLGRAKKS